MITVNCNKRVGALVISAAIVAVGLVGESQAAALTRTDLQYLGAFKVSPTSQAGGKTGFGPGRIAVNPATNSFFINGLDTANGNTSITLAEFAIPAYTNTTNFNDLVSTGAPIQNYSSFITRIPLKDPSENIRAISGMEIIGDRIFVNTVDVYDSTAASGDNAFAINDLSDLANSTVTGFYEIQGKSRANGWMSKIPTEHQAALGGDYLFGSARQASVNSQWSMGPSAYSFTESDLTSVANGGLVNSTRLQDYPLANRMWWQMSPAVNNWNYSGGNFYTDPNCPSWLTDDIPPQPANENWKQECVLTNDMWTEVSRAFYGAIIPGTDTYLTFGFVGGLEKGIGYKNFPIDRAGACSGECAYDQHDHDNYFWMFDVQDLIDHKNALTQSYDAQPYEYGNMGLRFDDGDLDGYISKIGGADYDAVNNRLYVSMAGEGELVTVIEVYSIAISIAISIVDYIVPSAQWTIVYKDGAVLCSSRSSSCELPINEVYGQTPIMEFGRERTWLSCIAAGCTPFTSKAAATAALAQ